MGTEQAQSSDPPTLLDVAVVGGGVIGVAAAWRLASLGVDVGLFERDELGSGASLGNAGQLRVSECIPLAAPGAISDAVRAFPRRHAPVRIASSPTPSSIRWLLSFASAARKPSHERQRALAMLGHLSRDLFIELAGRHGELLAQGSHGALDVYETASALRSAHDEAAISRAHGFTCEVLGREEARSLEPMLASGIAGALWFPEDTSVDPRNLLNVLSREARQAGARIFSGQRVRRIVCCYRRAQAIVLDRTVVKARTIVIACGHATGSLTRPLGLQVAITTGKGCTLDLVQPRPLTVPVVFVERHAAASPLGGRTRIAGGMVVGARRARVSASAAGALERSVREVLPGLDCRRASQPWAGLRPLTPDGLPLIGRSAQMANLLVAAGHGMLGVTQALGTAELVSALCTGHGREPDLSAFSPDRFSRRRA
jgi:D-amino-acid dehydrogenase